MRCPTVWGCPHPNVGKTANSSKTCVNAMTPKQPMPKACSAEGRPRRVTNLAAATARKTHAANSARKPFRTAALIRNGAV
jgi:hypothetical protein